MRRIGFVLALLLASTVSSLACGGNSAVRFCTKLFYAGMQCVGGDQLPVLSPNWEPVQIYILHAQAIVFQAPASMGYMFAGNSYNMDVMAMSGQGEISMHNLISPGSYMVLPTDQSYHVDLHVSCSGGNFQAYYVLTYTDVAPQ